MLDLVPELERALRKLHQLSLRNELEEFDRDIFVDNRQLSQLETNDWQVLFGRRGTGKTTLLNAFAEHVTGNTDSDTYCIMIDMRKCVPSASGIVRRNQDDPSLSLEYFYEFIRNFARALLDEYTSSDSLSALQRLIRKVRGRRRELDDIILEICEIAEYQPLYAAPAAKTITVGAGKKVKRSSKRSMDGSPSLSILGASITMSMERGTETQFDQNNDANIKDDFIFKEARRYQPLKRKLDELLKIINANRLYILIDEWADLNRLHDDNIQPLFAELLRKTFSGSERVTIKIASIKGATKFNVWGKQGGMGLELGADIFEACDLDQAYVTEENSATFFEEMIFKRLCKVNPQLKKYSTRGKDGVLLIRPPDNFFSYIFKDRETVADIVKGGGKIPRDFILLFCACAHSKQFSLRQPWRRGEVLKAISQHSVQTRHDVVSSGDEGGKLFYEIVDVSRRTHSRLFLVKRNLSREARDIVDNLYHGRLIHPADPSTVPLGVRSVYDCYYVDYGYFLEASEYSDNGGKENIAPFQGLMTEAETALYVVDVDSIVGGKILCSHDDCGASFRKDERSYEIRGLCPSCFRPVSG